MHAALTEGRAGAWGWVAGAITLWALLGGLVLAGIVVLNVLSVLGGMFGAPVPGDFELTEVGVAVAAFAFLPYCQLTGANISADIFTARLSLRGVAGLRLVAALVALLFAAILLWRMTLGMLDQRTYDYVTAIVQFPIWLAFLPILISLALLALAALVSVTEACDAVRRG